MCEVSETREFPARLTMRLQLILKYMRRILKQKTP